MSKLQPDILKQSIEDVLQGTVDKPRKFLETIDLQIGLKDYDTQRDKRFSGSIRLPYQPRVKHSVCVLADQVHCEDAKKANLAFMDVEELKKLTKQKKLIKALSKKYDSFLASQALIPQIPKLLGPGLNKAGKFPTLVTHNDSLAEKALETSCTVKFQLKKVLNLSIAVGNANMTKEQLKENIVLAINFLVSLLKKNWNNLNSVHIRSTMGKSRKIYP